MILNSSELCVKLNRSSASLVYFALDSNVNFFSFCSKQLHSKNFSLLLVPLPEAPWLMASAVFSRRAEVVRQRVSDLAVHGFYAVDEVRMKRQMYAMRIIVDADDLKAAANEGNDEPIDIIEMTVTFGLLCGGSAVVSVVLALERYAYVLVQRFKSILHF